MNIVVTGAAGFIGFHLTNKLLKDKNNKVLGIDSLNNYYSRDLKKKRISILKKKKNFLFSKINLTKEKITKKLLSDFCPEAIFHLAGQPGVLYSFKNPASYYLNNIEATNIIIKITKDLNIKKFIYGSSSSVYGDQKKFPIKENFKLYPKNPYAITKLKSELIVKKLHKTKTDFIIFRFFTVYGSLGRPDMFIHKFLNSIKKNKIVNLHNNGLNYRDFTYVGDVVKILNICLKKKLNGKIINISRCNPIRTDKLINMMLKFFKKKKFLLRGIPPVKGEMLKTHGSNKKLINYFGKIKFKDIKAGLRETVKIYRSKGF